MELYTVEQLASMVGCSKDSLRIYLCRAEFSHFSRTLKNKHLYYGKIDVVDIDRLKELVEKRKHIKRKNYFIKKEN